MRKVCHLTSVHQIDDVRILIKECASLASYGYDVTCIVCGDVNNEDIRYDVKCISINVPVNNRLQRMMKRSVAIYKKAIEIDAEIYHFHDPELLPVGLKLKKRGKKVIYDSHEDLPRQIFQKEWIPFFLRSVTSKLIEKLENFYVSKLDAVVTVTDPIAKRFSTITKRVVVCCNYASLSEFETIEPWVDKKSNICYIGGITKIRGIVELAKSIKATGSILELAGSFDSHNLKEQIINQDGIIYHGFVNRSEIKLILSRSLAGMVTLYPEPNILNSIPVKLIEYMAAGIPVIASDIEAWRKIIEENGAGICVDPKDVGSISNAILYLKSNADIAMKMGKNGRKAFEEKYNWQIEVEKLYKLYDSLYDDSQQQI